MCKSNKIYHQARLVELTHKNKHRVSDDTFDYAPLYGLSLEAECRWQEKTTKETESLTLTPSVKLVKQLIVLSKKIFYSSRLRLY